MVKVVLIPNTNCGDLLWDYWHTFEMSASDSKSSLHFTRLGLMGMLDQDCCHVPGISCLMYSAVLHLLLQPLSLCQNTGYLAYSSVILFISDSLFPISTYSNCSAPALSCFFFFVEFYSLYLFFLLIWFKPTNICRAATNDYFLFLINEVNSIITRFFLNLSETTITRFLGV